MVLVVNFSIFILLGSRCGGYTWPMIAANSIWKSFQF